MKRIYLDFNWVLDHSLFFIPLPDFIGLFISRGFVLGDNKNLVQINAYLLK